MRKNVVPDGLSPELAVTLNVTGVFWVVSAAELLSNDVPVSGRVLVVP